VSVKFAIELQFVDGRRVTHEFDGEQVTVGSSPDARLTVDGVRELAPQHVLLIPRKTGCWVSAARGVEPRVTCEGKPIDNIEVPWGTELDIGSLTLRVAEPAAVAESRDASLKSAIRIFGMLVIAAGLVWFIRQQGVRIPAPPVEAPALFDDQAQACSAKQGTELDTAMELAQSALIYFQRYPFDAQEGIRADRFLDQARACFEAGRSPQQAKGVVEERERIRARLDAEYRTLLVQLTRSIGDEDYNATLRHAVKLHNFLEHRPGKYTDWLSSVIRFCQNKVGEQKKKKKR